MSKDPKHFCPIKVDLADNIWLCTDIPQDNHAALRSGFAGYPANPRWTVSKFKAWKTGRRLREALSDGSMAVRQTDSLLVPISDLGQSNTQSSINPIWCQVPIRIKHIFNAYQTT